MIHQHYDPHQILWFLRNYWKYTRESMIDKWHKQFHDPGFGKSQYQWLKSRYGMKEEWGAALNHPPYPGARPGSTGTEEYEPPNVPTQPPRVAMRTQSTSPVPNLVAAASRVMADMTSGMNTPAGRRRRYTCGNASMAGTPGFSIMQSVPQTPISSMGATPASVANGRGTYTINNLSAPGGNGGSAYTYSMSVGSPSMSQEGGTMPSASSMAMLSTLSIPTVAAQSSTMQEFGSMPFSGTAAQTLQNNVLAGPGLAPGQAMPYLGGELNNQNIFPMDVMPVLDFNNCNSSVPFSDASTMPGGNDKMIDAMGGGCFALNDGMKSRNSVSNESYNDTEHTSPSTTASSGNGSVNNANVETVIYSQNEKTQSRGGGKRKRMSIAVELETRPKRPLLDPSLQISAAEGLFVATSRSSGVSQQESPATSEAVPKPASDTPVTGTEAAQDTWHAGAHFGCSLSSRHSHDSKGGIHFAQAVDCHEAVLGWAHALQQQQQQQQNTTAVSEHNAGGMSTTDATTINLEQLDPNGHDTPRTDTRTDGNSSLPNSSPYKPDSVTPPGQSEQVSTPPSLTNQQGMISLPMLALQDIQDDTAGLNDAWADIIGPSATLTLPDDLSLVEGLDDPILSMAPSADKAPVPDMTSSQNLISECDEAIALLLFGGGESGNDVTGGSGDSNKQDGAAEGASEVMDLASMNEVTGEADDDIFNEQSQMSAEEEEQWRQILFPN